ncbi:MAG: hypothetical protein RI897_4018 [Verrucomicrobiota bacterium]
MSGATTEAEVARNWVWVVCFGCGGIDFIFDSFGRGGVVTAFRVGRETKNRG